MQIISKDMKKEERKENRRVSKVGEPAAFGGRNNKLTGLRGACGVVPSLT